MNEFMQEFFYEFIVSRPKVAKEEREIENVIEYHRYFSPIRINN